MRDPGEFILTLDESLKSLYKSMEGSCYEVHKLFKTLYPEAEGFYNSDHIITKINDEFFDINGPVDKIDTANYLPFSEYGEEWIATQFK